MKNFSDLLAIDSYIDIEICTDKGITRYQWDLLKPLTIISYNPLSVLVDGIEILEFGYVQNGNWRVRHDEPFYRWWHRATGQGWLLEPLRSQKNT